LHGTAGTLPAEYRIFAYLVFVLSLFVFPSAIFFAVLLMVLSLCLAKLPFRFLKAGWIPVGMFLIFTFASNAVNQQGRILYSFGPVLITWEGLDIAAIRTARVFLMIGGVKFLMGTTGVDAMIGAMSRLLRPFEKIGIPVTDFFHVMVLTLECFPRLQDAIAAAYGRHVAGSGAGNLWSKAKMLALFLLPLFVESIRSPEHFFKESYVREEKN
jgi:energy-coupling factor transport system permease protein